MKYLKATARLWIYLFYFTITAICQEYEFDLENLIDNFDHFSEHSQSLRSSDDIYASRLYASDFLRDFNNELRQWKHSSSLADWSYKTNITDYNRIQKLELASDFDQWWRRKLKEVKKFRRDQLPGDLSRQLTLLTYTATSERSFLNKRRDDLLSTMEGIYGSTVACLTNSSCLLLEPSLIDIMTNSRDPEILLQVWLQWRNSIGPKVKPYFTQLIQVLNEAAVENGFPDYSEFWKQDLFFNTSHLDVSIKRLWMDVQPLYLQLHAYVRRKLRETYGSHIVGDDGSIPAHLLGNMWAQHWPNIMDIVSPYPEYNQQASIEEKMKKNLDIHGLFRLANNFYSSIGLYPMSSTFWEKSMFKKPIGREVVCHASAFDMYFPGDFRIKMCAELTFDSFRTVHHEMGHIEYFMAYADQPTIFREGANAAFHEAVGDTIQLSVLSDTHLKGLGFIDEHIVPRGEQTKFKIMINNLLSMALEKIAFLPFGLLVDSWRWDVMKGTVNERNYNRKWWEMRAVPALGTSYLPLVHTGYQQFGVNISYLPLVHTGYQQFGVNILLAFSPHGLSTSTRVISSLASTYLTCLLVHTGYQQFGVNVSYLPLVHTGYQQFGVNVSYLPLVHTGYQQFGVNVSYLPLVHTGYQQFGVNASYLPLVHTGYQQFGVNVSYLPLVHTGYQQFGVNISYLPLVHTGYQQFGVNVSYLPLVHTGYQQFGVNVSYLPLASLDYHRSCLVKIN
ncbi:hypothetical protein Btru_070029 [Bulinus truncatus]|nr:hypothetical protein Btru_070029 [Bulinus truncatus]